MELHLTTEAQVAEILQQALESHDREADLRFAHRMALKKLQVPGVESDPDFTRFKTRERRLWTLVQLLNNQIGRSRWDIVDLGEEIDDITRRLHVTAVDNPVASDENEVPG